jgi:hypothetical protein
MKKAQAELQVTRRQFPPLRAPAPGYVFQFISPEKARGFTVMPEFLRFDAGSQHGVGCKTVEHPRRESVLPKVPFRSAQVHRPDARNRNRIGGLS